MGWHTPLPSVEWTGAMVSHLSNLNFGASSPRALRSALSQQEQAEHPGAVGPLREAAESLRTFLWV